MPPATRKIGFDPEKLATLQEPLNLRITKIKGGHTAIWMPGRHQDDGEGAGYFKTDLAALEGVLPFWAGSGNYQAQISDVSGNSMTWPLTWADDNNTYPPHRSPPPGSIGSFEELVAMTNVIAQTKPWLNGVSVSTPVQQVQQTPRPVQLARPVQQQPVNNWWPQPQSLETQQLWGQAPQGFAPPPFNPYQPGPYGYPQQPPFGYQPPTNSIPPNDLRIELEKERNERAQERLQAQHETQLKALQDEIRRIGENANKSKSSDVDVAAIIAAERRAFDEKFMALERENREREDRRREEEARREELRRIEDRHRDETRRAETAQLQAQNQAAQASSQMIGFVQSALTQSQQTTMQIVNAVREQTDRVLEHVKTQPNAADMVMRNVEPMMGMMGKSMQMIMEMQQQSQAPGPHPVLEGINNAVDSAKQVLTKVFAAKAAEANANSNIAAARAAEAQSMSGYVPPPQVIQAPPADSQLNGHVAVVPPVVVQAPPQDSAAQTRDEEMFGEALPQVENLRMHVYAGKLTSAECAGHLWDARNQIIAVKADIKAFKLFEEGKLAELVDELIPRSAQSYQQEVIDALIVHLQDTAEGRDGEEDEDESEDEEDEELPPVVAARQKPVGRVGVRS